MEKRFFMETESCMCVFTSFRKTWYVYRYHFWDLWDVFTPDSINDYRAVKNPYRFTQLGVGWVLRDVSVHHTEQVIDFLNAHSEDFSKEALRYATEKMKPSDKKKVNPFSK